MAEESNTLPLVNAIDSFTQQNSRSNMQLASNMSAGLMSVTNSVRGMEMNLTSISSQQLRAAQDMMDQAAFQHAELIANQSKSGGFGQMFDTFINVTNAMANRLAARQISQLEELTEVLSKNSSAQAVSFGEIINQNIGQLGMFKDMGMIFASMNAKLADIAAHTMHTLDYYTRQEREKYANITGDETERPNSEELEIAIGRMTESILTTQERQNADIFGKSEERAMNISQTFKMLVEQMKQGAFGEREGSRKMIETLESMMILNRKSTEAIDKGTEKSDRNNEELKDTLVSLTGKQLEAIKEEDVQDDKSDDESKSIWRKIWEQNTAQTKAFKEWAEGEEENRKSGLLSGLFGNGAGAGMGLSAMASKLTWRMLAGAAMMVKNPAIAVPLLALAGFLWYYSDENNKVNQTTEGRTDQLNEGIEQDVQESLSDFSSIRKAFNKDQIAQQEIQKMLINKYGYTPNAANLLVGTRAQDFDEMTGENKYGQEEIDLYNKLKTIAEQRTEKLYTEAMIKALESNPAADKKQIVDLKSKLTGINNQLLELEKVASPTSLETKNNTVGKQIDLMSNEQSKTPIIIDNSNKSNDNIVTNVNNGATINVPVNAGKFDGLKGTPAPKGLYDSYATQL